MNRNQAIQFVFSNQEQEERASIWLPWGAFGLFFIFAGIAFVTANKIGEKVYLGLICSLILGDALLTSCFSAKRTLLKKWILGGINFFLIIIALDLLAIVYFIAANAILSNPFPTYYLIMLISAQVTLSLVVGVLLIRKNLKKYSQDVKPTHSAPPIVGGVGVSGYLIAKILWGISGPNTIYMILEMLILFLCIFMVLPCTICFHKAYLVRKYDITDEDMKWIR